ncbi:FUSC family protein [Bacillus fonticola]|uniref:FUSC family protein n=1 Tax=Bacillus fonticola TaxID=2728853 RepID=UPI001472E80F|nr:aromatic acid exporter family protein [Bacillus fonticola]
MRPFLLPIVGPRIVKTAIATFLTAAICIALELPPAFAVITAVVTIEPTAGDSIKKGIVRLPAAAIGALFAIGFFALFEETAWTYALSAAFTIALCYKLRLHAGILVATLTAVVMIPTLDHHYIEEFFSRMSTTTIGLLLSTAVNFFILPPHYEQKVEKEANNRLIQLSNITRDVFGWLCESRPIQRRDLVNQVSSLVQQIDQSEEYGRFQTVEWTYHKQKKEHELHLTIHMERLAMARQVVYRFSHLLSLDREKVRLSPEEKVALIRYASNLSTLLQEEAFQKVNDIQATSNWFWQQIDPIQDKRNERSCFVYELYAITQLVEQLQLDLQMNCADPSEV